MRFSLDATDPASRARAGRVETAHSVIETPMFMPVGTVGTVKGITVPELETEVRRPIILGNTYHLSLRPGLDTLRQLGGLHRFMGWNGSILTD